VGSGVATLVTSQDSFPSSADVVIVGVGGIVGASLAHFLAELGVERIVGLEKAGAIPSDIASTAHASDFIFNTSHDKLANWTTAVSRRFYEDRGFFFKRGGLEICRVGDDARWEELKRKVGSGKAFGTNARLISAREAREKFPLLDESSIRGALWDPDAGLVVPRSLDVVLHMVRGAEEKGVLRTSTHAPATGFEIEGGRVTGVHTPRGSVTASLVVVTSGIWGPRVGAMAGVPVPLWPVEHPLLFFGPLDSLQGTDQYLVHPLLRDQGNSAYVRDTGRTEGGMLEWGYYEEHEPRLVDVEDIGDPRVTKHSPSMRELPLEQVARALEKASDTVPIFGDLGWDERTSFNGLLSVTPDGGSLVGESPEVRGLWLCEAVWVKDGPGVARLCAEWITRGAPAVDVHSADIARASIPLRRSASTCAGAASRTPRPSTTRRSIRASPSGPDAISSTAPSTRARRSSVATSRTRSEAGSVPTRTRPTRRSWRPISPGYRSARTSGTDDTSPTRPPTPSTWP
jgi:glycine/D-amino acid oxidase-like deaminating enzyme